MKHDIDGCTAKYQTSGGVKLFRYRFDAGRGPDGKRRLVGRAGFKTRAEAKLACEAAIAEYKERGTLPAKVLPTQAGESYGSWLRTWLKEFAPQTTTQRSLERYSELAGYILNPADGPCRKLAEVPLKSIGTSAPLIDAALQHLLKSPTRRRAHLAPKSVRDIKGIISTSLSVAFLEHKIISNPMPFVRFKFSKNDRKEVQPLTPEQIEKLLASCKDDWTFTFLTVAAASGARRGELLALEWPDVDWLTGYISISKSLQELESGELQIKKPKNGRVRRLRLGKTGLAALRLQQQWQERNKALFGPDYGNPNLVFATPDGNYWHPAPLSQTVSRRMKRTGLKASLHVLRHSHASVLLSEGVSVVAVSARLGHASTRTTLDYYAHLLPGDDSKCVDVWEQASNRVQ
jgi:integrase